MTLIAAQLHPRAPAPAAATPLRIMPLGDSITRGSYLTKYPDGPYQDTVIGRPNPAGGGWRKPLQDRLRAAHVPYVFVGALRYGAYAAKLGDPVDPSFAPHHHGLAGFSNTSIRTGGVVPTPADVLAMLGVKEVRVPDIVTVLAEHNPGVILLMAGANGFNAAERDLLLDTIVAHFSGHLFVATILPQVAPRAGAEQVDPYNRSLPATVTRLQAAGHQVHLVEMNAAVPATDLLPDGVHPTAAGMEKMAATWYAALHAAGLVPALPAAAP